jgi:L-alanine-DL-glutamate epimerase-like enolase superfamily enzyme
MKIISIETKVIDLKLKEPFRVSLGLIEELPTILVKIETSDGLTGYGESAPLSFVTGETIESVESAIKLMSNTLIGMDSHSIEKIHYTMNRIFRENNVAKAGIDLAIYDILAKRAGVPLYKYLGGSKNTVETDKTISMETPEKMAKLALAVKEEGFSIVKVKLGETPKLDIARIKAVREAIGPDMRIRIDANQGWSKNDAIKIINAIEKYDIDIIEQPLKYWDLEGHRLVREKVMIPLIADESLFSPMDAMKIIRSDAFDLFNIKLMKSAGLHNAMKISDIGEAAGYQCMVGCMGESLVGITAGASFIAGRSNVPFGDIDSTFHVFTPDSVEGGVKFQGGNVILSEEPGLGIKVKW